MGWCMNRYFGKRVTDMACESSLWEESVKSGEPYNQIFGLYSGYVSEMQSSSDLENPKQCEFKIGQRVHWAGDCRRIGTVKYVGEVEGYSGNWVGVEWDNRDGKHDGSVNGVRYFNAQFPKSASFARSHNLSTGVSLLQALDIRYRTSSTKEEEDEMYVLSASNKRVNVQLLGKDKIEDKLGRFEELPGASLFYLGVSSSGDPFQISKTLPNLKELDLTGNLLSEWQDVAAICSGLPALTALNLSSNTMSHSVVGISHLTNLRILVLNNTAINWSQASNVFLTSIEELKDSLRAIEELHVMGNKLREITTTSSNIVQGFDSLRLLNLEDNYIADWGEILKLSQLKCLEQLHLNKNSIEHIWYPAADELPYSSASPDKSYKPFQKLRCLLIGANKIEDVASIDALNSYPGLVDIRCSENPATDPRRGGIARYVLIARLAKVEVCTPGNVKAASKFGRDQEASPKLKAFHGIEDERPSNGPTGPQKMASGLIAITLKCVGPSIGEKPPLTKKLPATTTVGKLKTLCESFFKLKSIKPLLYLQEEGSPLPTLLDDDMASLNDAGVCTQSTILVDEER
ncbi:CAP Gly-rich domain-containing protein [Cynara cardunculus var. scolymus]|uniref:CAP Gly-rich domain-containing protein n=1 Tax=Cynara cardunculus var. scolymus TaxID=59895 RepID=A0A103XDP7_CYNCS|nr:CAP Gly-rich domain-containing protein [Cynara cardunculus var. scolymus]